eukprot:maker-scaffold167_size293163-snap-gene-1.22 protein:Tk08580 transcript:maker-scaffold167_size293163-snap-gene-1.22-mRNA-1 annotation:"glycosyl-phosphatidylinositol-linked carbonic anhydrase"
MVDKSGLVVIQGCIVIGSMGLEHHGLESCFPEDIQELAEEKLPYGEANVAQWKGMCAIGFEQSPIDIPRQGNVVSQMELMEFTNYASSPAVMRLTNTGREVKIDIGGCHPDARIPKISRGNLNGTYVFYQAHFHWGQSRYKGSEHLKSGTSFPMEVQLLHYNEKYESMKEALDKEDGIAGLVVFFQMASDINFKLDYLVDFLPNVTHVGASVNLEPPFPLFSILPRFQYEYFRYSGSLTSPPCSENVIWTVLEDTVPITLKQMSQFDNLFRNSQNSSLLHDNIRSPQPLHNRTIYQRLVLHNHSGPTFGGNSDYHSITMGD